MISRKMYMKDVYSKYWINARDDIYGFLPYDRALIDLIDTECSQNKLRTLLEVAIGTGNSIASTLVKRGYELSGVDISRDLIERCSRDNPTIQCVVGDAEDLNYLESSFDLAYCVHSSWFMPDFEKAISEMTRVVKRGGLVVFDVLNSNSEATSRIYKAHVFENATWLGKLYKTIKNTAKLVLQKGIQDWPFIISQVPSDPVNLIDGFEDHGLHGCEVYSWNNSALQQLETIRGEPYVGHDRLVFVCRK